MMKKTGLMMVELMIALMVIAITAGAYSLRADIWKYTAKREAGRLLAKLNSLILPADRTHTSFTLKLQDDKMIIIRENPFKPEGENKEYFEASHGCTYRWKDISTASLTYNHLTSKYVKGGTIVVTGNDGNYYVVLATNGSRVRMSHIPPP